MFSKENRRFTLIIITLLIVVVVTIQGVGKAIAGEHSSSVYMIGAVSAGVILQLLSMLRQEQAREEARATRAKIVETSTQIVDKVEKLEEKADGNMASTIKAVAQEVTKAKEQPAPGQEQMPRTPEELQGLIKLFVHEMKREVVEQAIHDLTAAATKEAVLQTIDELKRAKVIRGT